MHAKRLTPILNVSDIQQSFVWFEKLGWKKGWDWGSPATFGGVCSGDCEIFLCQNAQGSRGKSSLKMTFGPEGDTDREFSASFDRQASATNSVSFLGLFPPKANKTVSFFVSFDRGATQSGILFLVSIERGGSRRVYDRGPLLSDVSQLGDAPCRCLARPSGSARRCRRTEARKTALRPSLMKLFKLLSQG
jgi:hypothetical protein